MLPILEAVAAGVVGLGLIAGVFWLAFRRMPDAREPPTGGTDLSQIGGGWNDGNSG